MSLTDCNTCGESMTAYYTNEAHTAFSFHCENCDGSLIKRRDYHGHPVTTG